MGELLKVSFGAAEGILGWRGGEAAEGILRWRGGGTA